MFKSVPFQAEQAVCNRLSKRFGKHDHYVAQEKHLQNKDIDIVTTKSKSDRATFKTYSVKLCNRIQDYGYGVNFEIEQSNESGTYVVDGNFIHCEADMYVIVSTEHAFIFRTPELRDFILNTTLSRKTTNNAAIGDAYEWADTRGVCRSKALVKTKCINVTMYNILRNVDFWVMPLDEGFVKANKQSYRGRNWRTTNEMLQDLNITLQPEETI